MKILSIHIRGLFELFNYDIVFPEDENVLIITGPNGYGKTMILNIIFNLFNQNFSFFDKLVFSEIRLCLEDEYLIQVTRPIREGSASSELQFSHSGHQFSYTPLPHSELLKAMIQPRPMTPDSVAAVGRSDIHPFNEHENRFPEVNRILGLVKVHLIREQRLFKKVLGAKIEGSSSHISSQSVMEETISICASELKTYLKSFSDKANAKTQELDSSYPSRLRTEKERFDRVAYEQRYALLKAKQEKLTQYGLYEMKQAYLDFSDEDAKALTVYLKDLEQKLAVFDEVLKKLDLFTGILNERRFTFKTIQISPEKGFYFQTDGGKELALEQLSSGEQHEVVLLYELIFNVDENVLVLIDEPEISLHVTWQKEFLNDLLQIAKLQNIQVIVATHAPAIVNGRWDLTYTLEKTDA